MEPQPVTKPTEPAGAPLCNYLDCNQEYAHIIFSGEVNWLLKQAVIRQTFSDILLLCRVHYRKLRTKDGYSLGFRKQDGRIVAYVKMEHF